MITDIKQLSPVAFENLIYDLLITVGMSNVVWRTPGRDGGRDIEGTYSIVDFSGYRHTQKWYIECKRYEAAVDWPTVRGKLAYAESHGADFLLMATTSNLSPQAVDEVNRWNERHTTPQVRFWNGHEIFRRVNIYADLAAKYSFQDGMNDSKRTALSSLSLMVSKFTQAAYGAIVFNQRGLLSLEAADALAALSLDRIRATHSNLSWTPLPFRVIDAYEWVSDSEPAKRQLFDRHGFRAFLAVFRAMQRAKEVALEGEDGICTIKIGTPLNESQKTDLIHIALVGDFECRIGPDRIDLIIRKPS